MAGMTLIEAGGTPPWSSSIQLIPQRFQIGQ
jgi:hypothetical protein